MRTVRKLTMAVALAVAAVQSVATTAHADTASAAQTMQSAAQQGVSDGYPGVIALISDGVSGQYVSAGTGNLGTKTPIDPTAKFRIGSNTKNFTATVILQLEAEGKLSINDTVAKWLPNAIPTSSGYDGSKVTLRELMNHTSGLPNYFAQLSDMTGSNATRVMAPQDLVNSALLTPPGTTQPGADAATSANPPATWNYINTGYILLGMVIQKITGNDPAVEITNRIINPLNLSNTSFPTTDPNLTGNYLHGYWYNLIPIINVYLGTTDATVQAPSMFWTAGAMVSTLQDLMTFTQSLVRGTLLPPAQMAELETTVPISSATANQYGLSITHLKLTCSGTTKWVWSFGGDVPGYNSRWMTSEDGRKTIAYVSNEFHNIGGTTGQKNLLDNTMNAMCAL
ncbi:serine hydrolase domain-containing protein [Nocardia stercoris]|nr:serine hydrolase domain-containing protein [Nocardia stercoris]